MAYNRIIASLLTALVITAFSFMGVAQQNEFGVVGGISNYFGDLNTNTSFQLMKPSFGAYYRYNYDSRLCAKLQLGFAKVEGNDALANNYYQIQRNLSFYSDIFEVALTGEFNFMDYDSKNPKHYFTPYLCTGISVFNFDPRTTFQGEEYRLQPIGTEGQGLPQYPDREPYKLVSRAWIIGGGFKFRINRYFSTFIEIANRKTRTDYLDDVSTTYADRQIMFSEGGPLKVLLSDRSLEVGDVPIGTTSRMRGDERKRDDYFMALLGLSFTINTYKCPF
ncbi:MAG: DUF6089 family protein [Bacteroidota bacterium]|jgi:hypothetical protein